MKSRKLIFLLAAALMVAFTYVTPAHAGGKTVWENPENPCNKLKLGGDMRFRYETMSRNDAGTSKDRDRERIRVRLNFNYNTGKGASAGITLATSATKMNTQNQTLEGIANQAALGNNFGIDKAYIQYGHASGMFVVGGKFGAFPKQYSNAWINGSHRPEGIALGWGGKVGGGKLAVAVARFMMLENSYASTGDDRITFIGLKYAGKAGDIKYDIGVNNLVKSWGAPPNDDISYMLLLVGAKWNKISGGIEIMSSDDKAKDKSSDDAGMVIHVRYKMSKTIGFRFYLYDLGAYVSPVPPTEFVQLTQNFTGTRLQVDVKAGGVNMDFRILNQAVKNGDITTWDDASLMQFNFVVGF